MKANRKIISQANKITAKYSKWLMPKELQDMYKELEEIGITVGMVYGGSNSAEWYINDIEVDNSRFIYSVYKDYNVSELKNEYTIYFS